MINPYDKLSLSHGIHKFRLSSPMFFVDNIINGKSFVILQLILYEGGWPPLLTSVLTFKHIREKLKLFSTTFFSSLLDCVDLVSLQNFAGLNLFLLAKL